MATRVKGLRIDTTQARRKFAALKQITADRFRPELEDFTRKSIKTAIRETPVRNYALIKGNQLKQYRMRINYIPSAHELINPSLRVRDGKHWLFCDGKWLVANEGRRLSNRQWSAYQALLAERSRRMVKPRSEFVAERAQARFLYRKSWLQVGQSLGLDIPAADGVRNAETRHEPPVAPPRGFGQWRGGKRVLSVAIYNPLLEAPSRYKPFSGKEIIGAAMEHHEPNFKRRFHNRLKRIVWAIMNKK